MKTVMLFSCVLLGVLLTVMADTLESDGLGDDPTPAPTPATDDFDEEDTPAASDTILPENAVLAPLEPPLGKRCECGVFKTKYPTELDSPLISQSPSTMACDDVGQKKCINTCVALAEAAKDYGPELLCASLGHYSQLSVSVHSRICGAKKWSFTGLATPTALCCHNHRVVDCKDIPNRVN